MDFLNYKNDDIHLDYDDNGFLFLEKSKSIYFKPNFSKIDSLISFNIDYIFKNDMYYKYNISVIQECTYGNSVAHGEVEIYYNESGLQNIIVNGKPFGDLTDRYNDCFEISPDSYIHLIYNKDITSFLNECENQRKLW